MISRVIGLLVIRQRVLLELLQDYFHRFLSCGSCPVRRHNSDFARTRASGIGSDFEHYLLAGRLLEEVVNLIRSVHFSPVYSQKVLTRLDVDTQRRGT